MRLEFEEWVLSQNLSETAEDLCREAITCYKASAYRAALLLSYLGFQTIVKMRILDASRPDGIDEAYWRSITDRLTDDSTWDCTDPRKLDRYDSSHRICPEGETQWQSDGSSHPSSRPRWCWKSSPA
jgi:hypothetical protein